AAALLEALRGRLAHLPDWLCQAELRLGRCYEELGEPESEVAAHRRALAAQPTSAQARFALACSQLRTGHADEALGELELLGRGGGAGAPPELWAWWARALVTRYHQTPSKTHDWAQVERLLGQAERVTPDDPVVAVVHAELHLARRQPSQAEAVLREA